AQVVIVAFHIVLVAESQRPPELHSAVRELESRGHDTDDALRRAVEEQGSADRVGVASETPLPKRIAEEDCGRGSRAVILRGEEASDGGLYTKHRQYVECNAGAIEAFRFAGAAAGEIQRLAGVCAHGIEGSCAAAPIVEVSG